MPGSNKLLELIKHCRCALVNVITLGLFLAFLLGCHYCMSFTISAEEQAECCICDRWYFFRLSISIVAASISTGYYLKVYKETDLYEALSRETMISFVVHAIPVIMWSMYKDLPKTKNCAIATYTALTFFVIHILAVILACTTAEINRRIHSFNLRKNEQHTIDEEKSTTTSTTAGETKEKEE